MKPSIGIRKTTVALLATGPFLIAGTAAAAPTYSINKVLVAEDQWTGEDGLIDPKPIYKPHESDASYFPDYWMTSNERDDKGGITVLNNGNNAVLAQVNIDTACIKVVQPNGSLGDCAPPGAEEHPRHAHGVDIDQVRKLAYQVAEHSGLQWNANRTAFLPAESADTESGLLIVYDIKDPKNPKILKGYVLGHAAEENAVNESNGKVYVGNHEPSPTNVPCFVSVINPSASSPYKFIDLPNDQQCVQGIEVDEGLKTVNGTTHIGQKMYTFNSTNDTIAYSVDIRGPFNAFVAGLPADQQFTIPADWVIHMHDLTTDRVNHRAYQTIHTIASATEVVVEGDEAPEAEITGRWVAEVNTNPRSRDFKKVRIIDLSNGQSVPAVPTHEDNPQEDFTKRFVHAHFVAVDPFNGALLVSGEHTGNLGVVDTGSRKLKQVIAISRPIPGCVRVPEIDPVTGLPLPLEQAEPHVHGVNIQALAGTAYVSDEGEDCFYESVTVLKPSDNKNTSTTNNGF